MFLILLVRRSVITGTMTYSVGGEKGADVSGSWGEIPYYHGVVSASGRTDFRNKIAFILLT